MKLTLTHKNYQKMLIDIKVQAETLFKLGKNILTCEIIPMKQKRSISQNNFYWKNLEGIANVLNEAGKRVSIEILHYDFKRKFDGNDIHDINKKVFGIETTSKMNKKQFSEYFTEMSVLWQEETKGNWTQLESANSYFDRVEFVKLEKRK